MLKGDFIDKEIGIVGIFYVGEFNIDTKYEYLNAVTYEGSTYICINENGSLGKEISNTDYWFLSAKKPERGVDYLTPKEQKEFEDQIVTDVKKEIDDYAEEKIDEISKRSDVYNKNEVDLKLNNYLEFEVVEIIEDE